LTEVFRQVAQSRIVVNAHRINRGEMPELNNQSNEGSDFYLVEAEEPDDAAHKIIEIVCQPAPGPDPPKATGPRHLPAEVPH
jgi:exodeoxyribonuclease V alpha subunit